MKTILVDAVGTFVIVGEGINREMFKLLEGYLNPKIILTNANDEQMKTFGLIDLPYEVFTLKHKPDKTDPVYFEKMLAHLDLTPNEVIYFEHDVKAVKSAKSVGIKSYFYNAETKDLRSLRIFLDENI